MKESILTGVLSAVAIGLLCWAAALLRGKARDMLDRQKVHRWLRTYTRDEPGESHVDTTTLAKGTRLPDERVRRACMSDPRIHRFPNEPEQWSVWRKEPQSIYEKRGLLPL